MAVNDEQIGNANTKLSSYGSVGAFNGLFPQDIANQAMSISNQLYPQLPEADPWEAAFQFFAEMGRQASQPGATVLGSAVGSMQAPLDYLNAKKKEKAESDRARMQSTITLGTTLKGKGGYSNVTVDGKPTVMTQAEITAAKAAGKIVVPYEKPTTTGQSKLTPYTFNNTEGVQKFQTKYPNITLTEGQINGTETISLPNSTVNDPDLVNVFSTFSKPGAGSQYERLVDSVNNIGVRLADPTTAKDVSQSDRNLYAANYQKLVVGGEYTEIVDGKEVTRSKPGIDLSGTTNLPIPEGLDLNKIIEERSQKFDQNQNTSATFGSRMLYNEGILRNQLADGYVVTLQDIAQIKTMRRLGLGNIGIDPKAQQFHIAAQNWVAAQLRNESGAAIAPSEYIDALDQYFPKVGDSADTIKQKQALREEATKGMINSAQDAFGVVYPNAIQYLKYKSGDETYDILNPQGYANELLAKTALGQNLMFKDAVSSMTIEKIREMLAIPGIEKRLTKQMLTMLSDELNNPDRKSE